MPAHHEHAQSFGAAAEAYDRARPGYPDEVVDWMLEGVDGRVVDVGAGTGKLTASLASRRTDVVAVEPDDAMRAAVAARRPAVWVMSGSAERIPLVDASAGLVTLAQAWHWVDVPAACAEVARVLAPGGRLALVWNYRDESDPWVARLGSALGGIDSAGKGGRIRTHGPALAHPFTTAAVERLVVGWEHHLDVEGLVDLAASRSHVIALDDAAREKVLTAVRQLGQERAGDGTHLTVPYRAYAFRVRPSA